MMSRTRPLQGSCSCGRNHYSIVVPTDATEQAEVYFDDSKASRRTQATPLTAWLRVPLTWVYSTTIAQLPDETHSSIRRIFSPRNEPHCKRIFCGYCGTHLSYWTEKPASEADYLNVTLGSLFGEDIRALKDLDLLSDEEAEEFANLEEEEDGSGGEEPQQSIVPQHNTSSHVARRDQGVTRTERHGRSGDLSWFEEMIDGSRLGRMQKRRKGMGVSADGSTTVQWEVSEYREGFDDDDDDDEPSEPRSTYTGTGAKRKHGDVGSGDDVPMTN